MNNMLSKLKMMNSETNIPNLYEGSTTKVEDEKKLVPTNGRYPFEYYNPVQSAFYKYRESDSNFIICAATSAGKTIIAELSKNESGKFLYLSPLKAITEEKRDEWSDREHHWGKYNISILTGDYVLTSEKVALLKKSDIVTLTSEMLDSRTRRMDSEKNDWLLDVSVLVIDEFHLIGYDGRGDKLETAIMRFTAINPKAKIVILSATLSNLDTIAKWVSSLNGKNTIIINSEYRPVKLIKEYVTYRDSGRYADVESYKGSTVLNIIQKHRQDKVIVFVHSKKVGREFVGRLRSRNIITEFHNGDLPVDKRKEIERSFKSRDKNSIQVLVSTSTLAWGVNTPADVVILYGLHRGLTLINQMDVVQMIGRAGRIGKTNKNFGKAYILVPESKKDTFVQFCEKKAEVKSTLLDIDVLAFHVCAEINAGIIKNVSTLKKWYSRSLSSYEGNDIDSVVESLLDYLKSLSAIAIDDGIIKVTPLGKVSAIMYFSPKIVKQIYSNFTMLKVNNIALDDLAFSWAISNHIDYETYANKDVEPMCSEYVDKVSREIQATFFNNTQYAGFAYYSALQGNRVHTFFEMLKTRIKFESDRLFAVTNMIQTFKGHWGFDFESFRLRLLYEVPKELLELITIPGIGKVRATKLYRMGVKSKKDILKKRSLVMGILGRETSAKVFKSLE